MLTIEVPGFATLELTTLVLDLNGTASCDGHLVPGVAEAVEALSSLLRVVMVTADTRETVQALTGPLGTVDVHIIERGREAEAKLDLVDELGSDSVVAIGNGANDALMLRDAALGIAVVGGEGAAVAAVQAADIVTSGIGDALGLLLEPRRVIATLRR